MKAYVVTLGACAVAALGAPIAQAHVVSGEGAVAAGKAGSSQSARSMGESALVAMGQSTLAAMVAAGTKYHATANYRNEKTLVGSDLKSTAQKVVRPDDRAGRRGI
jgi:hypothetical protein